MHQFDSVLKALLTSSENSLFARMTGAKHGRWLNVEFPKVNQRRVDLLFQSAPGGELIGVELQSRNDRDLPLRMAEYALAVYRKYRKFPRQYVLYVGREKLRMASELLGTDFNCRYAVIDIRTFDAEKLLASPYAGDAVLAILAKHGERRDVIRRILLRIAKLEEAKRRDALTKLGILAGIRRLGNAVETEAKKMPIHYDILDHDLLGPILRRGRAEGLAEGLAEGKVEGRAEEAVSLVRRQLKARFGPLPAALNKELESLNLAELENLAERLISAASLSELFEKPTPKRPRKIAKKR